MWSQGGESYLEQYPSAVGSAGQNLERLSEGPSAYLNGTPNMGNKSTLERSVRNSPRGHFVQGLRTGPAQMTQIILDQHRRMACRRSGVGPDPYNMTTGRQWPNASANNIWSPRTSHSGFLPVEAGQTRTPHVTGRTHTVAFDKYHVSSRNQWHHTSQSIRSILAPPMPQTPNGSSLLPLANRNHAYSRMRSAPHTAPHTVPSRPSLPPRGTSWRLGGARPANPFH